MMMIVWIVLGFVGAVAVGLAIGRLWGLRQVAALDDRANAPQVVRPAVRSETPDPAASPAWGPSEAVGLYDVVLVGAKDKIAAIRAVRASPPDVGLIAARQMIERLPLTLRRGVSVAEAERLRAELERPGGQVEVRPAAVATRSDDGAS